MAIWPQLALARPWLRKSSTASSMKVTEWGWNGGTGWSLIRGMPYPPAWPGHDGNSLSRGGSETGVGWQRARSPGVSSCGRRDNQAMTKFIPCDSPPARQLDHVARCRAGRVAVRDLILSLPRGQVLGLLGVNGAGKSTTLSM